MSQSTSQLTFYVGQAVWVKYEEYPWWPCLMSELQVLDKDVDPGDYCVLFLGSDSHGNVKPNLVKKLDELNLEQVLRELSQELRELYENDITRDYEIVKNREATDKEAVRYPEFEVTLSKKRSKNDQEDEFDIEIKRTKYSDQGKSLAEDYLVSIFG